MRLQRRHYRIFDWFDALTDLNRSLDIEPNSSWEEKRGEVYRMLRQYHYALNDLNKSLQIEPNNSLALSRRGDVYRMLSQYDNALNDLNNSLAIDPDNAFALRVRFIACVIVITMH